MRTGVRAEPMRFRVPVEQAVQSAGQHCARALSGLEHMRVSAREQERELYREVHLAMSDLAAAQIALAASRRAGRWPVRH